MKASDLDLVKRYIHELKTARQACDQFQNLPDMQLSACLTFYLPDGRNSDFDVEEADSQPLRATLREILDQRVIAKRKLLTELGVDPDA